MFEFSRGKILSKPNFIRTRVYLGAPIFFWSFMSPYLPLFIAFLLTNFRKFSKFGVYVRLFFQKIFQNFSKISWNFLNFFKIEKNTIIFAPKIVQNHYINENLTKFSLKISKNSRFSLKILNFSQFSAPSAPKIWSLMSKNLEFMSQRVPPK